MRISSTTCKDILNDLRGYPQRPARISSTTCEDILAKTFMYIDMLSTSATVNDMDKKIRVISSSDLTLSY